ncbi:hypothetical protein MPTK1_1g07410 [Marchantia polymorpha subsp. ruderalis]|uniref:Uncharacterized protein n=2 Tax=Marchantia polymorpha TaxID=3197 RepID=A0AAF6AMJ9_MARPO|nr:hypothetical protein MARPO_0043s0134 [Marchantia polymorpha]BBM97669.1 hypothetical protein Mp_1g07410 [Marchantia polymorpha subsp. ruderalis]|eukprot:PTQ39912.1 hypothetical protein MARPO_0043s0134 [Marchantia polymorpha]
MSLGLGIEQYLPSPLDPKWLSASLFRLFLDIPSTILLKEILTETSSSPLFSFFLDSALHFCNLVQQPEDSRYESGNECQSIENVRISYKQIEGKQREYMT